MRGAGAPAEAIAIEARGDRQAREARRHYGKAHEVWEQASRLAERLEDPAVRRRAREAQAALAALSLDTRRFGALDVEGPARPRQVVTRTAGRQDPAVLERLGRLLESARHRYPRLPEAEARDVPLIYEALALVRELTGDLSQSRADAAYREALRAAEAKRGAPGSAARVVRLRFKLRDFAGAWAASRDASLARLEGRERCEHLGVLRQAAVLLGRKAAARRLARERRDGGCPKAPFAERAVGRLGGLLVGSRADLLGATRGFVSLGSAYRLPERAAVIASFFAAVGAAELGEWALVEELLRRRAGRVPDDPWLGAAILARLSFARDRLGDYEAALRDVRRARRAAGALRGTASFVERLDLNEARLLLALGKPEEALILARKPLDRQGAPVELRLGARLLVGSCFEARAREDPGKLRDAEAAFTRAAEEIGKLSRDELPRRGELAIQAAIHLGNIERERALAERDPGRASAIRRRAIERQDGAMRQAYAEGLYHLAAVASSNLGELHVEAGDSKAAREFVLWALAEARKRRSFEVEWRCHWYLGRIAAAEGDEAASDRELAAAIELIESYRDRILDAETKSGFMSDKMDVFRFLARRHLDHGRAAEALEVAERSRAQALVESLGWRFVALAGSRETSLYREYIGLVARAAKLRRQGPARSFLGVEARSDGPDYDALRDRLTALRARLTGAESPPALRALVDGAPAGAAEIRRRLSAGTRLVEYFDLGPSLVAFVVDAEGVRAARLPVSHRQVSDSVREFLRGGAADAPLARRLHEQLVAPIDRLVPGGRVIIVPYGILHRLPFEALRRPHDSDGYLIHRWEISYLPSASLIRYLEWNGRESPSGASRPVRLLALADPDTDYDGDGRPDKARLAGARREVASFAPSFARRKILEGARARESTLRRLTGEADVLHIACHGEYYPARPWSSTLFLAADGGDPRSDGFLRAYEVYGLDLRGQRLVTLSGCETGLSDVAVGDDPSGLATAFLHSGASSLLVSLWKVEDRATAALMASFYRRWIDGGKARSTALREAKLELVRGGFSHPRQWASFVLIADG